MSNSNPKIKTFTFPNEQGTDIVYDLAPQWSNVENKPDVYTKDEIQELIDITLSEERVLVSDVNGAITSSSLPADKLQHLANVTDDIQKQIDERQTTIVANASDDDIVILTGTNGTNEVTYSASHADSGVTAGTYRSVTVDAKGHVTAGSNPNYAGSSSDGGAATSAVKLQTSRTINGVSFNGTSNIIIPSIYDSAFTTAGTGAAYTVTINGITELSLGLSFIIIPHTTSTSITTTLAINGLSARQIRRRTSTTTTAPTTGNASGWIAANKPIRVTFDGTYWIADITKPIASDLGGIVAISNGGTGATTAANALKKLGGISKTLLWENPNMELAPFDATKIDNDYSAYDGIEIIYKEYISTYNNLYPQYSLCRKNTGFIPKNEGAFVMEALLFDIQARRRVSMNDSSIIFSTAATNSYGTGGATINNDFAIPLKIYGITGIINSATTTTEE